MTDQGRVRRALDGDDSVLATRTVPLDDVHIRAGSGRDVTAYAAVWMSPTEIVDSDGHYREQNAADCMNRTIEDRAGRIFSVYNHAKTLSGTPSESDSVPIGKPIEIRADAKGLLTVTRYNKSARADEVLEAIRNGALTGMSYTGVFLRSDPEPDSRFGQYQPNRSGELTLVTRQEIALIEYGPTPIPAYKDALVLGVRNKKKDPEREVITVSISRPEVTDTAVEVTTDVPESRTEQETPESPPEVERTDPPAVDTAGRTETENDQAAPQHLEPESPGRPPAPETPRTEPHVHSAAPTKTNRSNPVDPSERNTAMTIEERVARQSEVRVRLAEIDSDYQGAELTAEARAEWADLQAELITNERAIADASQRAEYLRQVADLMPSHSTESIDNSQAGLGQPGLLPISGKFGPSGPAFHRREDIYDLQAIRNRARNVDEVAMLYREYAQRAVEQSRFPSATGMRGAPTKEDAQTRVAHLLDTVDDEQGSIARRILVTGSQLYDRAFGKLMQRQSLNGLTAEESRALQLGTDASGGFAVPFQLDPTVVLTTNGVINPLRQISRVETITGKEWDGVTTAGVTVNRGTESQEVGTGDPSFAQPSVRTQRVMGWIPFSIELDLTWNAMRGQMTALLADAKDIEEATAFAFGNGTAPNPSGVVSTLGTASRVTSGGSGVIQANDIYLLENAMNPRFRQNSSVLASKTIFNKFRSAFQQNASAAGDPFVRPSASTPGEVNGYPMYELSTMSATSGTADLVMLQGDFKQFLIVDRVGMGIELVPHLLGTNRRPTGERGIYALWFNSSKILVDNAFRLLQVKAT